MAPSIFLDRGSPPERRKLEAVLGESSVLWTEIRARLAATCSPLTETWSYSGKSHGWLLRLARRKKPIVYLVPHPGYFVASLVLNEKGIEAAEASGLPQAVLEIVRHAPEFPEGRNVRIEVREERRRARRAARGRSNGEPLKKVPDPFFG